jgi:hypothetical protein
MPTVPQLAVRAVKPVLGDARWQRLKKVAGRPAPPSEPARELTPAQKHRRRLRAMDLTQLAAYFDTDKWGLHRYTPHYERHLRHLRQESFTLLELGIGGYRNEGQGGGSLRMWKNYFPHAQVVGLDIEDKSFVERPRITTYQGSQTDEELLRRVVADHPDLRVVIDDGSHVPEHIRATFAVLFPLLPDGGIYAIEDTQTSYWPDWGGSTDRQDPTTTMALVKDLIDGLNYEEFLDDGYAPTYADRHVVAVHCYHNLVVIEKGDNREGTRRKGSVGQRLGQFAYQGERKRRRRMANRRRRLEEEAAAATEARLAARRGDRRAPEGRRTGN